MSGNVVEVRDLVGDALGLVRAEHGRRAGQELVAELRVGERLIGMAGRAPRRGESSVRPSRRRTVTRLHACCSSPSGSVGVDHHAHAVHQLARAGVGDRPVRERAEVDAPGGQRGGRAELHRELALERVASGASCAQHVGHDVVDADLDVGHVRRRQPVRGAQLERARRSPNGSARTTGRASPRCRSAASCQRRPSPSKASAASVRLAERGRVALAALERRRRRRSGPRARACAAKHAVARGVAGVERLGHRAEVLLEPGGERGGDAERVARLAERRGPGCARPRPRSRACRSTRWRASPACSGRGSAPAPRATLDLEADEVAERRRRRRRPSRPPPPPGRRPAAARSGGPGARSSCRRSRARGRRRRWRARPTSARCAARCRATVQSGVPPSARATARTMRRHRLGGAGQHHAERVERGAAHLGEGGVGTVAQRGLDDELGEAGGGASWPHDSGGPRAVARRPGVADNPRPEDHRAAMTNRRVLLRSRPVGEPQADRLRDRGGAAARRRATGEMLLPHHLSLARPVHARPHERAASRTRPSRRARRR